MSTGLDLAVVELPCLVTSCGAAVTERLLAALAREHVRPSADEVRAVLGLSLSAAVRALMPTGMSLEADAERAQRVQHALVPELVRRFSHEALEAPGATELLESLRGQGLRVAVVTHLPGAVAESLYAHSEWYRRGLADTVLAQEDLSTSPALEALHRTGVSNPRRMISIGETAHHLRQSTVAGAGLVVAVSSAATRPRSDLTFTSYTHSVTRLTSVLDVIALYERSGADARSRVLSA